MQPYRIRTYYGRKQSFSDNSRKSVVCNFYVAKRKKTVRRICRALNALKICCRSFQSIAPGKRYRRFPAILKQRDAVALLIFRRLKRRPTFRRWITSGWHPVADFFVFFVFYRLWYTSRRQPGVICSSKLSPSASLSVPCHHM